MSRNRQNAVMWGAIATWLAGVWLLPEWGVFILMITGCLAFAVHEWRKP